MHKLSKSFHKIVLPLLFASSVFFVMLFSMLLSLTAFLLLANIGFVNVNEGYLPIFIFSIISIILGTIIAMLFSRIPLRPLRNIMNAIDKIANGNFDVHLNLKGTEEFQQLSTKFNNMAKELRSVEMLRNDFVNNFSHEFKTPIVSIRGFAKILKMNHLTLEERDKYLNIIIEESERLADLSINVLNLSKIEQQTILAEKEQFNLTEQIRLIIIMLENKWEKKNIYISIDDKEVYIYANKEMLKQVWINLLDNAIKFSPENGEINIEIQQTKKQISVSISNQGNPIPTEIAAHIFDKFYQGDTSHTTRGYGLGLTIAKKIIELHNGFISVSSIDEEKVVFHVSLCRD